VARAKVGVQLSQQGTTIDELRASWRAAGDLGVDSLWVWDHFFPLYGDPNASHYEAYSLLGAMAVDTRHAQFGVALAHGLPVINARLAELRPPAATGPRSSARSRSGPTRSGRSTPTSTRARST